MDDYEVLHQGSPITKASKALILLHGRGATVAAPQAPNRTWYPHSFIVEEYLNEPYLSSSVEQIKKIIDEISRQIPKQEIYIMGFSQGACLTLEVSSRFATKYGGIIAFTGGLIGKIINEKKYLGNFKGTKVFIGTSDQDPHVPLIRSQQSKEVMDRLGAHVTLKVYPGMGHAINQDEINWVKSNIITL
jgi:phospholipase/carboxylesterase